jgi:hypothetical protein
MSKTALLDLRSTAPQTAPPGGSFFEPNRAASSPPVVKKAAAKKAKPLSLKDLKYKPGSPVLRRFWKDREEFWCDEYEVFDREKLHSVAGSKGGFTTLKPKRSAGSGKLWVIKAGQQGRVATETLDNVRLLHEHDGPVFDFGDVYFRLAKDRAPAGNSPDLTGYVFDEAEDLALAGDVFDEEPANDGPQ